MKTVLVTECCNTTKFKWVSPASKGAKTFALCSSCNQETRIVEIEKQ